VADTIGPVQNAHRLRCDASRAAIAKLRLDDRVDGRGDRPVWALQLQVLRELAQHAGHAEILREQVLASRNTQLRSVRPADRSARQRWQNPRQLPLRVRRCVATSSPKRSPESNVSEQATTYRFRAGPSAFRMSAMPQVPVTLDPDPNDDRALQCWVDADAAGTKLRLLLDTGSSRSSVPREGSLATADLHGTGTGRGVTGDSATDQLIRIRSLGVGDLTSGDVLVELQPENWPHPPLLGTHVFEPYACAFRFSKDRIDVGVNDHADGETWGDSWTPGVELCWDETSVRAVWDTGAGITIVDQTWAQQQPEAITVSGLQDHGTDSTGRAVAGLRGTLASFAVHGTRFAGDQPCGIVDLSGLNAHMSRGPINMFLGLPQIRRVDWLLDFPQRKIAILAT